jgi:ABC-2 type transport system permease protein
MVLPWVPLVLLLMVLQAAFVLGIGLVLSSANAYFRDIQHFLGIFLNIWFYMTPILYQPELVPESAEIVGVDVALRSIMRLNPMATFVDAYRDLLYHLRAPTLGQWALIVILAVASLAAGALVFRRLEPTLAEEL